jgi:hypothetical protein
MTSNQALVRHGRLPRKKPFGFSRQPVGLEPAADRLMPYDRRKAEMVFYQFVPSLQDEEWAKNLDKVLGQIVGLREPVAFEVMGAKDLLHCQFVVQRRDAGLLCSALSSASLNSYLSEKGDDPLFHYYQGAKRNNLPQEYHLLDYHGQPPLYLPVFYTEALGKTDILVHLHSILEELTDTEMGFYQLLFIPCRRNWAQENQKALDFDLLFAADERRLKTEAHERLRHTSRFFAVALRVGGFVERAKVSCFMGRMHAVVRAAAAGERRLGYLTRADYYQAGIPKQDHFYLLFNRVAFHPGMLLTQDELAVLFPAFLPSSLDRAPDLKQAGRTHPAPEPKSRSGQMLGLNIHHGCEREVWVGDDLPNEHVYIVGKSGYGKTTLIEHLIRQHIEMGDGFGVIDPHGDLIQRVLPLVTEARIPHTLYFNPADPECMIPFNVLAHSGSQLEKEHLRADLLDFFEELVGEKLGVNIEHVLGHALVTLLSRPDSTLADIKKLLVDGQFRAEVVNELKGPELIDFWKNEFPAWSKSGALMTITNKLSPLLLPGSLLAPLLSSRANHLDFACMMENRGIFLCNIAQGGLTRRNSKLLGRLVLSRIAITAMMRDPSRAKLPWFLYVDEVQEVAGRSLEEILRGGRKFGLHLRINNQARKELAESLRTAVANAATIVSFAIDDVSEQTETEKLMGRKFAAAEIGSLPKRHAVVKMDGHVFNLVVPQRRDHGTGLPDKVIESSRLRFGVNRNGEEKEEGETMRMTTYTMSDIKAKAPSDQPLEEMYDEL